MENLRYPILLLVLEVGKFYVRVVQRQNCFSQDPFFEEVVFVDQAFLFVFATVVIAATQDCNLRLLLLSVDIGYPPS